MPALRYPLPPAIADAAFTHAEARAAGVDWRRLQAADVARIVRGVYAPHRSLRSDERPQLYPESAWHLDQSRRASALAPLLRHGRFFSGITAACLWNLPVPAARDHRLEVGCARLDRGPRLADIRTRRIAASQNRVVRLRDTPVSDPASVWAQLAPRLSRDDAVILGDAIIHEDRRAGTEQLRRAPLATREDLTAVAHTPRRRGGAVLRGLLPVISPRAASPPETRLRLRITEWGLPVPALDYDVRDPEGRLLGTSEIAFPAHRIAVEYEGAHHRTDARQWNRDITKYRSYTQAGWEVVRVTSQSLNGEPTALRGVLREALIRRGWLP